MPEPDALGAIRGANLADPERWLAVREGQDLEGEAVAPDNVDRYTEAYLRARPLVGFICSALWLDF